MMKKKLSPNGRTSNDGDGASPLIVKENFSPKQNKQNNRIIQNEVLNKNFKNGLRNGTGNGNNAFLTSDIEKELTDLTLSIEREMEKQQQQQQQIYTHGNTSVKQTKEIQNVECFKCSKQIIDINDACQAIGSVFHGTCFICVSCGRSLRGKPFYYINNHVYCEEDYLYSGFLENAEKCSVCGHIIVDMILQAVGKSYHPGCFRCFNCNECLDGEPFTLDVHNHIYCIKDYFKKYAPKCFKCKQAITPVDGTAETVRVVSMERDFHLECFSCENCDAVLTDETKKRCYPLGNKLLCYECHVKSIEMDSFTKILIENSSSECAIIKDRNK